MNEGNIDSGYDNKRRISPAIQDHSAYNDGYNIMTEILSENNQQNALIQTAELTHPTNSYQPLTSLAVSGDFQKYSNIPRSYSQTSMMGGQQVQGFSPEGNSIDYPLSTHISPEQRLDNLCQQQIGVDANSALLLPSYSNMGITGAQFSSIWLTDNDGIQSNVNHGLELPLPFPSSLPSGPLLSGSECDEDKLYTINSKQMIIDILKESRIFSSAATNDPDNSSIEPGQVFLLTPLVLLEMKLTPNEYEQMMKFRNQTFSQDLSDHSFTLLSAIQKVETGQELYADLIYFTCASPEASSCLSGNTKAIERSYAFTVHLKLLLLDHQIFELFQQQYSYIKARLQQDCTARTITTADQENEAYLKRSIGIVSNFICAIVEALGQKLSMSPNEYLVNDAIMVVCHIFVKVFGIHDSCCQQYPGTEAGNNKMFLDILVGFLEPFHSRYANSCNRSKKYVLESTLEFFSGKDKIDYEKYRSLYELIKYQVDALSA
ncbi:hypothetical protein H4219_005001 [Mycoemilia scoparia]|uniref:Uncharacterized protein n=1 Tax=Mycoemilia scoparia TaxID=417184 RepID=A0A9W7ZUI1_9FUNG|nr:hypothetical protein H4219_005001 [Mycoemilia scoparia]